MKPINDLYDLMLEQLRDLYDGEVHSLNRLPELTGFAMDVDLRNVLTNYTLAHESQIMRLRQVFELQFTQKRGEQCEGLETIVREATDLLNRCPNVEVRNAALITAIQHIIHYKIAGYGAICTYAKTLGLWEEASILHRNLEEEKAHDNKLIILAERKINSKAVSTKS